MQTRKLLAIFTAMLFVALVAGPVVTSADAGLFRRGCCDCCKPPKEVVLEVCHPCKGKVPVTVCIPACCDGDPRVCYRDTIIGCGKTTFEWCCGHTVVVRWDRCGEPIIRQRG